MDDVTIGTPELTQALRETLKTIPPAALTKFATKQNLLAGGFRPGKTEVLQERIVMQYAGSLQNYHEDFAFFLREQMGAARFLSLLMPKEIEFHAKAFLVFFTKPLFLLALLVDSREELRDYAKSHLTAFETALPEPEEAKKTIERLFAPILSLATGASPRRQNQQEDLRRALEEAQKSAKADRRTLTEAHDKELRELKAKLATAEWSVNEQKKKVELLENKLKQEEANRTRIVKNLLAERQIALFQGWLKPLIQLEEAVSANPAAALLERAESALKEQEKLDRAAQLVTIQETRLAEIKAMLDRVNGVLLHAQTKHPELVTIQQELIAERDAITRSLQPETQNAFTAEVAQRLLAATEEDYDSALELLKLGKNLGLISAADARTLTTQFHQLASRWAVGIPDAAKDLLDEPSAIEKRNPILRDALCGKREIMLFLDGHNILNGLGRYKQRRGTAVTHEEGRERVSRDLVKLLQNLPMTCAHLVWDGAQKSDATLSANVMVHFSGGTGEHRADRYIIDQLTYYRKLNPTLPLVLVTDDRGFAGEATRLGATVCHLHDFEAFLNAPTR